jgi:hypothetical protein
MPLKKYLQNYINYKRNQNMPESIFEFTDGRSSEDLTTEILHYILVSEAYAPYQRLFYSRLFPSEGNRSTDDYGFDVDTQVDHTPNGRPDIEIKNEKNIIIIENKFFAGFSNNDQMFRYFQYLKSDSSYKNKYLVLLTIKDRMSYYNQHMVQQFSCKESYDELMRYFDEHGIEFRNLLWEDILNDFDSHDFLISNFKNYIETKYLTSSTLEDKEMELINSSSVPQIFEKLWSGIDKIRDNLSAEDINVQRMSQSRIYYGFNISENWGNVWLGLYHDFWAIYKTPYLLHIRNDWIKEEFRNKEIEKKLMEIGFINDSKLENIFPIKISDKDIVGNCIPVIRAKLKELREVFEI